jgi:hypothetical protein
MYSVRSVAKIPGDYWSHNPSLHLLKWLKDPYYLEKLHYQDRPYPITSPAFSNVPLLGPAAAATIGKIFKPVQRMHQDEWDGGQDYSLYSSRLEPRGPEALAPAEPEEEFSLWHAFKREVFTMSDFIGLPGFIMRSAYNAAYPTQGRKQPVYLQGSRQMESTSRSYYEKNLGAGMFIAPEVEHGFMGYTEPLRRFIQPEGYTPQVNDTTNNQVPLLLRIHIFSARGRGAGQHAPAPVHPFGPATGSRPTSIYMMRRSGIQARRWILPSARDHCKRSPWSLPSLRKGSVPEKGIS